MIHCRGRERERMAWLPAEPNNPGHSAPRLSFTRRSNHLGQASAKVLSRNTCSKLAVADGGTLLTRVVSLGHLSGARITLTQLERRGLLRWGARRAPCPSWPPLLAAGREGEASCAWRQDRASLRILSYNISSSRLITKQSGQNTTSRHTGNSPVNHTASTTSSAGATATHQALKNAIHR